LLPILNQPWEKREIRRALQHQAAPRLVLAHRLPLLLVMLVVYLVSGRRVA